MSSTVFPIAVTSTANAKSVNCASANTLYVAASDFPAGVYTITCVSSTVTTFTFFNGNTSVVSGSTTSGTVQVNVPSSATRVTLITNTGSNVLVNITLTSASIAPVAGILDTITSSTTYTETGLGYVVALGGGGGGGYGYSGGGPGGGGGGGSGGIATGIITLNGSISAVVGSQGSPGSAGGATTFSNLTANGGNSGGNAGALYGGGGGSGGTPSGGNGGGGGNYNGGAGGSGNASASSPYNFVVSGATAGGNGGSVYNNGNVGSSGINYGGGGGGGAATGGPSSGTAGIIYVVRI